MNFLYDVPIIDCHWHHDVNNSIEYSLDYMKDIQKRAGVKRQFFLSCPDESRNSGNLIENATCLFLKKTFENSYAFAGLEHFSFREKNQEYYLNEVRLYQSLGFDGIKLLDGKPDARKKLGIRLCDSIFDLFYDYCQSNQIPITMHVADPIDNWNINKADKIAIEMGWCYDNTFPSYEELLTEVKRIMQKFPSLRLRLAHMGFLGNDLQRAKRFLDDYENTGFDLTPGGEQFFLMLKNKKEWETFFEEYSERIVFGSDTNEFGYDKNDDFERWFNFTAKRLNFIKGFFNGTEKGEYENQQYEGFSLSRKCVENIFFKNAVKLYGEPKIIAENAIEKLLGRIDYEKLNEIEKEDYKYMTEKIKE